MEPAGNQPFDPERTTTALLVGLSDPRNAGAWEAFDRRYRPILTGFVRNCGVRDVDAAEIAQETVRLRQELRLKIPDAIVYATASTQGCLLVSRNTKEIKDDWPAFRIHFRIH